MNILVLASGYPYPAYPFCGIFSERCVGALSKLGHGVEVLAPRPYVPPFFSSFSPRWKAYATAVGYETKNEVSVYRPAYLQLPRVGGAFYADHAAFYSCRQIAKKMHDRRRFDVILSFDLVGPGVMAWRIGRYLGLPSCGWIFGRIPKSSSFRKAVGRALNNLDIVFYQSHECFDEAAALLMISRDQMPQERHIVLAHGITEPPILSRADVRKCVRRGWGIQDDQVLVLTIGRVCRDKGIYELLDAISLAEARDPRIRCIVIGAVPALDETMAVEEKLANSKDTKHFLKVLSACEPEKVWEYLCAADIFAFPSHHDAMPNALLEAMAMGVPAIAFAIPPVMEIVSGRGGILTVPPFNASLFSEAILRLANSPQERTSLGEIGKTEVSNRFMAYKNMAKAVQHMTDVVSSWVPHS